jgi:hypothetical protein
MAYASAARRVDARRKQEGVFEAQLRLQQATPAQPEVLRSLMMLLFAFNPSVVGARLSNDNFVQQRSGASLASTRFSNRGTSNEAYRRHTTVSMELEDGAGEESSPSDVEGEVEAESEPLEPPSDVEAAPEQESDWSTTKEALKTEISGGLAGAQPDKIVVGEMLLKLEAQNPTASPANSPLLNGKWKFLYASGASPGLKTLQLLLQSSKIAPKSPSGADIVDIGDTYLTISPMQPRAVAEVKVRLLSFENTIKLASNLEEESAARLSETYDSIESEYMDFRLPLQQPAEFKRSVLISYLDDELMVVRDAMGRPDILSRVQEPEAWPQPSVDSAVSDDVPGATS